MDELEELVDSLSPVVSTLQKLGIRHYVGGSVASSFHGAIRSTMDVDLVCELTEDDISQLIEMIGADFYVSETAAREAVRRKGCFDFNLRPFIHISVSNRCTARVTAGPGSRSMVPEQLCWPRQLG